VKAACPTCRRSRDVRYATDGHGGLVEVWGDCVCVRRAMGLCRYCDNSMEGRARVALTCADCGQEGRRQVLRVQAKREQHNAIVRDRYATDKQFRKRRKRHAAKWNAANPAKHKLYMWRAFQRKAA
jgi:hypothetical protein